MSPYAPPRILASYDTENLRRQAAACNYEGPDDAMGGADEVRDEPRREPSGAPGKS
jgi:hypothetical protein